MSNRILITGIGIISGIGNNVEETLTALTAVKSGITSIKYLETIYKNQIPVSEVKLSNIELFQLLGLPENTLYTRSALIGIHAAREAVQSSGITDIKEKRTGLISGTTVGGMDISEKYYYDF